MTTVRIKLVGIYLKKKTTAEKRERERERGGGEREWERRRGVWRKGKRKEGAEERGKDLKRDRAPTKGRNREMGLE